MLVKTGGLMAGGLFLVILLSSAQTQKTQPPETTHLIDSIQGPDLYTAYCAVCHGKDGKGGGPMAKALKVAPADLTRIAMRNSGKFPMARIQRIISGEEPLPAGHGTREMPVWGPIFSGPGSGAGAREYVLGILLGPLVVSLVAALVKEWGTEYHKPGLGTRILMFFFRWLPGKGPFSALKIRTPTPEVEKLFMASFNATVDRYKAVLANVDAGGPELPNANFDAGGETIAGKYKGTDEAYAKLLGKLADRQFAGVKPDLRENILAYYKELKPSVPATSTKKEKAELTKLLDQLDRLKAVPEAVPAPQVP